MPVTCTGSTSVGYHRLRQVLAAINFTGQTLVVHNLTCPHLATYSRQAGKHFGSEGRCSWHRQRRVKAQAAQEDVRQRKVDVVKRFYEVGWQSDDLSILDNIIAEDHIQEDQVWQSSPRLGRDSVKRGITFIRKYYPDVRFTVDDFAAVDDGTKIFARWTLQGTFEGQQDTAYGMALLTVNNDCLIEKTEVFRQGTRAEIVLAKRSENGPVAQGVLLEQGIQY